MNNRNKIQKKIIQMITKCKQERKNGKRHVKYTHKMINRLKIYGISISGG